MTTEDKTKEIQKAKNLYEEKEINLLDYLRLIYKYRLFLIIFVLLCLSATLIYNKLTPKVYTVKSSFFLPLDTGNDPGNLSGYARILGDYLPSKLSDYLKLLIESNRMKTRVAEDMFKQIKEKNHSEIKNLADAKHFLNLKKKAKIIEQKTGIFILSIENNNPTTAYKICQSYLKNISQMNKELEISAKKDIITLLDKPSIPKSPSKPKKLLNLILAFFFSSFFGTVFIFIYDYIKNILKYRN